MDVTDRFLDALDYAVRLHADQRRKGSDVPYVSHLLRVAGIVMEYGADEDEAIAALLHDAVEDRGGRVQFEAILARYGARVAAIVAACSDSDTQPKPPWRERKERYLDHLQRADASTRLISAADKLDNVRSTLSDLRAEGSAVFSRFNGGREGTLWYYRRVADTLQQFGPNRLVEELDRAVRDLERLAGASPSEPPLP